MGNKLLINQQTIRKIVVDMAIPEKVVEAVISHQFSSTLRALSENRSVEISGFGVFHAIQSRINRKMVYHTSIMNDYKELIRNTPPEEVKLIEVYRQRMEWQQHNREILNKLKDD